jgi:hypothetical protein
MINDDLYEDEVMRDVWERKAHVSANYGDWEKYRQSATDHRIYSGNTPNQVYKSGGTINGTAGISAGW